MATKTEDKVDVSQHNNCVDVLEDWQRQESDLRLKLQQLEKPESAARQLLASEHASGYERRAADQVLEQCKHRRAKIEAAIERAKGAMENLKKRIAAMEPEYQRQQNAQQDRVRTLNTFNAMRSTF
jgi:archaellum component FlaC